MTDKAYKDIITAVILADGTAEVTFLDGSTGHLPQAEAAARLILPDPVKVTPMTQARSLKSTMDELSPDDWLIRADGPNRYIVATKQTLGADDRNRVHALFWYGTDLDFRLTAEFPDE